MLVAVEEVGDICASCERVPPATKAPPRPSAAVLGRIVKLRRLAQGNANENEAAVAAAKAEQLMNRYGLSADDLPSDARAVGVAPRERARAAGPHTLLSYTRNLHPAGGWDINNPHYVDVNGRRVRLSREIKRALPGRQFSMSCTGPSCRIRFEGTLGDDERRLVDATVAAHQGRPLPHGPHLPPGEAA